jgi:electron transfer flavoprotein alpha subunit
MRKIASRFSTLLLAEANKGAPAKSLFQLLGAARSLGQPVDILLCGSHAEATAKALQPESEGVGKILVAKQPQLDHFETEAYEGLLLKMIKEKGYKAVVTGATSLGKDVLPRVAAHF